MTERGFNINYCVCGEILINLSYAKEQNKYDEILESGVLENLTEKERYCPHCKEVVKIKE